MLADVNNSFYVVTLIIIVLCFVYILIFYTFIPLFKNFKVKKELLKYLTLNNINYQIVKEKNVDASFTLVVDSNNYLVKVVDVKKNSDVNISVNKTLVMYYKTITNTLKSKEINEVQAFIKSENKNKILLLNSKVNKISYSKNEMEVIELKENDKVNNTKIINYNNFEIIRKK